MTINFRIISILLVILTSTIGSFSQSSVFSRPNNFSPPVDIPIFLSGTFGELRSNHFHSGIDIKTQGSEGKLIRSIDTGWVSRIVVSTSGYGKAIYITHPNGFVSVYGHLKKFSNKIEDVVIAEQYEKESFTVQLFFEKGEISVSNGEIIGYSGNTGGSFGPHLHFEIRDEKSQHPLNPLLFNKITIKDYYRPKITQLLVYPVDENSTINGNNDTIVFELAGWGENHVLKQNRPIKVKGKVSFGIGSYDLMNKISNKNGVYSTKLFYDTTLIFNLEMNRLSFSTTRYINSLIDYNYFQKTRNRVVRTQVDTNNMLNNYKVVLNNGILEINDTLKHDLVFEIRDAYGNLSKLSFTIIGDDSIVKGTNKVNKGKYIDFKEKQLITMNGFKAEFPANAFYRSFYMNNQAYESDSISHSITYMLHDKYTPVHKHFSIEIEFDTVKEILQRQYYIAYSEDNIDYYYSGNKLINNKLTTRSRKLGYYQIMSDTIMPVIKEVNFANGEDISGQNNLKISITDDETGIKSYNGYLNGKWILMEYEPKKDMLIYNYDSLLITGTNEFTLEISDQVGNLSKYDAKIVYNRKSK